MRCCSDEGPKPSRPLVVCQARKTACRLAWRRLIDRAAEVERGLLSHRKATRERRSRTLPVGEGGLTCPRRMVRPLVVGDPDRPASGCEASWSGLKALSGPDHERLRLPFRNPVGHRPVAVRHEPASGFLCRRDDNGRGYVTDFLRSFRGACSCGALATGVNSNGCNSFNVYRLIVA